MGISRMVCIAAGALVLASGFAGSALAQQHGKIRLAYASVAPGSDSTFLFAGQQLGFFKEQGVEVEIQISGGAVAATGFVASGAADLGLGAMEAVPGYVLKGVPIKAVYLYSYRPIFKLAFIRGSKVQKIQDLKGAKVGLISAGSASALVLQYILKEAGLSPNDVDLVPLGVGAAAVNAVKKGQADALMYHDTFYPILEANGIELSYYTSPALERGFAGQAIYGLEKTLVARRPAVEAFLRGLTKSLEYATKNPAGATKAFAQLHPEIGKNLALEEKAWRERVKISYPVNGQWGAMDDAPWANLLEVLQVGGMIKEKPPVSSLYTNDFLKAANSVDLSKVR
jgi:ABC-type nitrate/sulfonate/bicarbonate transport system substrate-binding protein